MKVALRGKMTPEGYLPENADWRDSLLTKNAEGRSIGKNPLEIPPLVLCSAGHEPRGASEVFSAWGGRLAGNSRGSRGIREHCLECSSNSIVEVRECRIYNCPAWPYRMGKNPFDTRRGKTPSFGKES